MIKKLNKWQVTALFHSGCLVALSVIYLSQSYFGYQQVKAASDRCYD